MLSDPVVSAVAEPWIGPEKFGLTNSSEITVYAIPSGLRGTEPLLVGVFNASSLRMVGNLRESVSAAKGRRLQTTRCCHPTFRSVRSQSCRSVRHA